MPLGYGRKRRLLSARIGISVATRDDGTETMVDVSDGSLCRLDVEDAACSHRYLACIGALFCSTGDNGPHEIARLEALDALGVLRARARKTKAVHPTQLS